MRATTAAHTRRRALMTAWALTLALTAASAHAEPLSVEGPPLAAKRIEALAAAAEADRGWGALAATYRLAPPSIYLDPKDARALYTALADRLSKGGAGEPGHLAAAHLTHRAARFDHYLGDAAGAAARVESLGLVTDWLIAGPFENGNMAGFDVGYGPEDRFDPKTSFEGKVGKVAWRPLGLNVRGYNTISTAINPDRSAIAYALTLIDAPQATRAVLRIGANGAYKVWLNGERVARVDTDLGGELDRDAFGVRLDKGPNVLMVKAAGENRGQLGFFLRFTQPDGRPMALRATTNIPKGTLLASPEPHKGAFEVAAPSEAAAEAARAVEDDTRARLLADAALINRTLRQIDPATPWRDLADEAAKLAPQDAAVLQDASSVLPEHWRRTKLLRAAAEVAPKDGWLLVELAYEINQSMGLSHLPEAFEIADRAIKQAGKHALLPSLLRARLWSSRGMQTQALALIEPLKARYPNSQPLLRTLQTLYSGVGRARAAQLIGQDMIKTRQLVPGIVQGQARDLLRAARPAEALALLEGMLKHRPDALSGETLRARALNQLGRTDEALAALDDVLARSPGLIGTLQEKGRLLEHLGREDDALAVYEEARQIAPENQALAERIRALRPDTVSYEATWRWGDDKLVPAANAATAHAGQDYYFIGQQNVIQVAPSGRSSRFVQRIIHVLTDEGAKAWNSYRIYYSPGFERTELVSVRVRKANGTITETHRRADYDAGRGSGNLYYLRRFAYIEVPPLQPGDVVEYAYREIETGSQNYREGYFGDLFFFESSVDLDHARYVVLLPKDMTLFTHKPELKGLSSKVEQIEVLGNPHTAHIHEARGISRIKVDARQPGRSEVFDYVLVSTYETWDQVGKWWWNLIKDQLVVDAEIEAVVKKVTKGLSDDRDKMKAIHNWVVKNTRYVGIEFGVHGWKPYRTTLCMRRKFGDCKDKASLIKVMLNAAGIDAHLVLIRTRRLGAVASSPANLAIFNHAIAYVPKFDLYLDGTAEFSGTEELPNSDQGQFNVIVADGGKVTVRNTPIDAPDANKYIRILDVDLRGGSPKIKGEINAVGADAAYFRSRFDSEEKRRENLEQTLSRAFPGAKVIDATFTEVRALEKAVRVSFVFQGGGFVKQIGDTRVLFPAGRELRMLDGYAPEATRDQDLVLGVPFTFTNKVTYHLPRKTRVATAPKDTAGSSRFGSYKVTAVQSGDTVAFEVTYTAKLNRINAEDYAAYREWLTEMDRALNQRLTLTDAKE